MRYLRFIDYLKHKDFKNQFVEKHHILPISLFPEYSKESWNIVVVSARGHYLCHWLLAKCFGGKMWFAFNQMKRIIPKNKKGILYELSRKHIQKLISQNNLGRKMTEENKKLLSKRTKNTVVVLNPLTGKKFRVLKNDHRLINGDLKMICAGHVKTEETKRKISEKHKGRIPCVNNEDVLIYVKSKEEIPQGFKIGMPSRYYGPSTCINTYWMYNPKTGEQKRIDKNQPITEEWIRKRFNGPGFFHVNNSNKKKYLNLISKTYEFLNEDEVQSYHCPFDGVPLYKIQIYRHNQVLIVGEKNFRKYLNKNQMLLPKKYLKDFDLKIDVPHPNCNKQTKEFMIKNQSRSLNDLGFEKTNLENFSWNCSLQLFI